MRSNLKKIKVMHILNTLGVAGMETVLVKMLKMFDVERFVTYVCCLGEKRELVDDLKKAGIEVFFVSKNNKLDFFRIFRLARLLREKKIDIVHSYSGVYRDGAIAAKLAGVPVILHTDQGRFYPDSRQSKLYHRILTNWLRQKVITVSEDLKAYLIEKIKINPAKISVIPNGAIIDNKLANFDRNAYKSKIGLSQHDLVFGIVARLDPVKDHNTLIEASVKVFNALPNAKLLIIGRGRLKEELEIKTQNLNIADKIVFLGKRRDITELLSILDLFVLSSKHEGISLSILEAMAQGLAVVATRVGGNHEIVGDNVTGLLVEPANAGSLANGIIELLKDKEKRINFGLRAREKVVERFSLKSIVRQYEELYNSYFPEESAKIKVMHLASNPEWAGAEVHLVTLADSLRNDKRVKVSVCVFHNGKLVDYLRERGVEVKIIRLKWLFDISGIFKLARMLKNENVSILHTHGYKANVVGALACAFSKQSICIRTEHGLTEPFYGFDRLKMNFYEHLDYLTGRYLTKKIISVSFALRENAITKYPKEKIVTVHNGIAASVDTITNGRSLREELGISRDSFIIGIAGRLVPVKGHSYFINAAKLILEKRQNVCFIIVGDGPLKDNLQSTVRSQGLSDKIIFTGFKENIKEIIGIMGIVVFSSLSEGIPYTLLEAMAERKAIVATRVGGLEEVISDGVNGLLTESKNEKEIAQKCLYLLENREIMQSLGKEAEKTIKENFSADKMKEETIRVYEESLTS